VVTGASAGIGEEVATLLAGAGARVFLVGRTQSKLVAVTEKIKRRHPSAKIDPVLADYADLSTLKDVITNGILAKTDRIDGILHNAGLSRSPNPKTVQGYETTLGVNDIAPHLVQKLLDPLIEQTAAQSAPGSVRIVWVSSSAHYLAPSDAGVHLSDLNNPPLGFNRLGVYGQSKAINIYQSIQWTKNHPGTRVVSVSAHPGLIDTDLTRELTTLLKQPLKLLSRPPMWGAYTLLYPLIYPKITAADAGKFFTPFESTRPIRSDILEAANGKKGEQLWKWLDDQVAKYQ
jgi:protochlorophyllide reductase